MATTQRTTLRTTSSTRRGFRTSKLSHRFADDRTPPVASARAYLRGNLPAIYLDGDGDFGLRFLNGLETVLDPIVATLDALPAYFHPTLAPRDVLELLAAWLGIEVDESWSDDQRRQLLRHAAEIGRRRGTARGLELMLAIAFPDLPLRVEDGGKVSWSTDPDAVAESPPPAFVVYCDAVLADEKLAAVARVIERVKPVHVTYRLRAKVPRAAAPRKPPAPPADEPKGEDNQ